MIFFQFGKNDSFAVPSVLAGLKSKDEIDREISEYVSTHQGESNDQSMFLKNGQYIFQNNENNDTPEEPFLKSVNRAVIPRDKSLYPGFPNTEG